MTEICFENKDMDYSIHHLRIAYIVKSALSLDHISTVYYLQEVTQEKVCIIQGSIHKNVQIKYRTL